MDMLPKNSPVVDLDPTTNYQLHRDVWNQLVSRIQNTAPESTAHALAPQSDSEHLDDISEKRKFGKHMRRLVKLVYRAVLNPGEQKCEQFFQCKNLNQVMI